MKKNLIITIILWSSSVDFHLFFIKIILFILITIIFDLKRSLILVHRFSCFSNMYLLSLEGTSVKYLFPLLSSLYPFILLIIRYKRFRLLIFIYLRFLTVPFLSFVLILFRSRFFILIMLSKK